MVYKAEETCLGRLVALKFLPPELACDPFRSDPRVQNILRHIGFGH